MQGMPAAEQNTCTALVVAPSLRQPHSRRAQKPRSSGTAKQVLCWAPFMSLFLPAYLHAYLYVSLSVCAIHMPVSIHFADYP